MVLSLIDDIIERQEKIIGKIGRKNDKFVLVLQLVYCVKKHSNRGQGLIGITGCSVLHYFMDRIGKLFYSQDCWPN